MNVKIDWLSFTLPIGKHIGWQPEEIAAAIKDMMQLDQHPIMGLLFDGHMFTLESGRAPYSHRWQRDDGGLAIFVGQKVDTALFEIGGKGCDLLDQLGVLEELLLVVNERLTRIDVACDVRTDTRPKDFADQRNMKRYKTFSEFHSPTGDTFYVGSRSSEVYARVYRYNAPHPRHALLRIEHVLKRKEARQAALSILENGLEEVAAQLGNRFGWAHDDWTLADLTSEVLPSVEREHGSKSTVYWLHAQVLPAIKRLHKDGELNILEWLEQHVLPEILGERAYRIVSTSLGDD